MEKNNTINGRTPEEIKRGLEYCIGYGEITHEYCSKCPYIPDALCRDTLEIDALALIRRLEAERDQYKHEIQQLESAQPKWISLKERLPEFERRVLVMNGHGDVFILAFWRKTENKWSWVDEAGHFKHYNNITHWMPLPSTEGIE